MSFQKTAQQGLTQAPRKGFGFPFRFKKWILLSLRDKPHQPSLGAPCSCGLPAQEPRLHTMCFVDHRVSASQDAAAENRRHSGSFLQIASKGSYSHDRGPCPTLPNYRLSQGICTSCVLGRSVVSHSLRPHGL